MGSMKWCIVNLWLMWMSENANVIVWEMWKVTHCLIGWWLFEVVCQVQVKCQRLAALRGTKGQRTNVWEKFHIWTELVQCLSFEEEKCGLESELTHKGWVKPSVSYCLRASLSIPMHCDKMFAKYFKSQLQISYLLTAFRKRLFNSSLTRNS